MSVNKAVAKDPTYEGAPSPRIARQGATGRHRASPAGLCWNDSYDNALAESVIGLYKTDVINRRGPWRTVEAVELATLDWVDWFDHSRLLAPIGYVPPVEREEQYYRSLEGPVMVAGVT